METDKELTKFDPQDIMDGVRQKIKASFVELIPEEHWNAMVQKEINEFFKERDMHTSYSDRKSISSMGLMINDELRKFAEQKIKDYLNSEEFMTTTWDNFGSPKMSVGLEKILVENSGAIFSELIGNIFQMKMSQMQRY